ncbi:ATR-interacting protein isoform X3 [Canis lupus familiaris]|uniref:ATR-interacting protein isoform X3 n=1 Tax=Canis lupus familiaris TaxID=9615 RepID=UPI000BAA1CC4|nr:ATR-interacting protein isoform X3 [Canis lupus familiaris]XP_025311519.2 ATR-interacting protein isoform X2 [Canis lupus dingo]|eukprot:XP_022262475.1 ATR-interacting protein isoform X3 [Canis lupus familiaris]
MAGTPAAGSRRRSGLPAPTSGPPPSTGHPPSKRARGFPAAAVPDPEDPFGAHGDFTADDLEELDTLASQALSQCQAAARDTSNVHKVPRLDGMSKTPAGKNRELVPVKDNFELEVLQTQYKELKEKMKAMEEEVLIKNGEIKILRDSLHQTESILEEQRRSHFLLEQEKTQALGDKEKEFSKKLQSLQSELQFKDAEMNELRTKLQSSERANKLAAPSIPHASPRKSPSVAIKPEASSPQFGKPSFPTKESFSANMSLPHPFQTEPGYKCIVGREVVENKSHSMGGDPVKQEESQKSLIDSWMQRSNTQGSILINLLLKQPLIPGSSLGLCHLLSSCSEAPTGTLLQPLGFGRFQCVFRVLPQCLSPESPLPSVLLTVELLSLLVDHEKLAPQLCSHSEGCLLLLLYMYITSRPDKVASETQWLQLEQEAVWLLAKLGVQSPSSPVTGSNCQCNVEVVRALTVMLHRQWLTVRRAGGSPRTDCQRRTVRCLRDTVLLLHGLSQKDKLFTVHCVEVLHQYDQVMPGVSMLIRGLPDVADCEEAALDDLCAAETDTDDPEMDCS